MQETVRKLIVAIAIKYKLEEDVVQSIVESQFSCARQVLMVGDYNDVDTFLNVRFKNLGLLCAHKSKIKAIGYARDLRSKKSDNKS